MGFRENIQGSIASKTRELCGERRNECKRKRERGLKNINVGCE